MRSEGDLKESATENTQPTLMGFHPAAMVKRRGKSSPVPLVTAVAWQTLSGARSNRKVLEDGSSDTFGLIA